MTQRRSTHLTVGNAKFKAKSSLGGSFNTNGVELFSLVRVVMQRMRAASVRVTIGKRDL